MIIIEKGRIYIDKIETSNPELIGYAMLDFAESLINKHDVIILAENNNMPKYKNSPTIPTKSQTINEMIKPTF